MARHKMSDSDRTYSQLVTGLQSSLYAYICTLLGGAEKAHDVLQDTNLVLWEKKEEYDRTQKFAPWASKIAYYEVLAHRKKRKRERLVFSDELVQSLSTEFTERVGDLPAYLAALDRCVKQLSENQRMLVQLRYPQGQKVSAIAEALGKKKKTVTAALYRVRQALAACVERRIKQKGLS